jgi:4-carboxymuconolactone decarboxylase
LTARAWTQQLEWGYHAASAAEHGIPERVIAAIAQGKRPARMARKDSVVYEFCMALERRKSVGDAIYGRAVAAFGEAGVIDLIGVIGYYTTLAMILNVARTPPPRGAPRLPSHRAARRRSFAILRGAGQE